VGFVVSKVALGSTSISLPVFIPPITRQSPSSIIWVWYNRPIVVALPSGLSHPSKNRRISHANNVGSFLGLSLSKQAVEINEELPLKRTNRTTDICFRRQKAGFPKLFHFSFLLKVTESVALLTGKIPGPNFHWDYGYTDWCFSWFYSVSPSDCLGTR
jgi:hypothetical protein